MSTGSVARRPGRSSDLAQEIALVSASKRELLLRIHRHRLRREDLEDCFSQATLELLAHVEAGGSFASRAHIANTLELRFLSRAHDCRRALSGRSPMRAVLERADRLDDRHALRVEPIDRGPSVEELVLIREELRRIGRLSMSLSADQRLVLGSQLSGESCAGFCARHGWSREKYRKVAQRARSRLKALADAGESGVPPARCSSDSLPGPTYEHISPHT
ncbi:MAG TPA: hypothetical protein VHW67_02520 [Solirubrobacteraceae bacterium]|nr:hypothetical protein [Solirubrobacteraceae bacterium]